jgi:Protein of unknown function (DUF3726)
MRVSLNEVEMTVLKAVRGAGRPWGLAEEAGRAARWLARRGLPWLRPLAEGLLHWDDSEPDTLREFAGLMDGTVTVPAAPGELKYARLPAPILLGPAVSRIAAHTGHHHLFQWAGATLSFGLDGSVILGGLELGLDLSVGQNVTISRASCAMRGRDCPAQCLGSDANDDLWMRLEVSAARTYVPESELSRLKGAGAGLTDND